MEKKEPMHGLYRNAVSYFGGLVIIVSLVLILLFLLLSFSLKAPSPYIGIFTYLIFPAFLTWGIFIFAYGLLREGRRRRRLGAAEALPFPTLDLNNPRHRKRFALILIGGSLLGILFAFVNYNAYLFTDSNTFCGKLCHRVMKPEYTAYLNGPHARVPCVDCHVGAGVSWYVKAKISGVPQVFATIFHTYSRPISVPIKSLRPARETCDECHWPEKFFGAQLIQNPYFRYNEKNTPEQISLLVKTGGGTPHLGENAGIHWHMIISEKVYFKATDPAHQHIPWVKVVSADGSMMVYKDRRAKLTDEEVEKLPATLMDCMDCHNRPSHVFLPPETAVDKAMAGGLISHRLPWIKKLALDALVKNYQDPDKVQDEMRLFIEGYYTRYYPDVLKRQREEVTQAVNTIFSIHSRNVFPTMKVNWTTYPNDIGHRNWPGCFRCHDNHHVNQAGKVLTSACSVCHTMPRRGPLLPLGATTSTSSEPWHPWPLKGAHERILCSLCHRAGYRPPLDCISCHRIDTSAPMMKMACKTCHLQEAEVLPMVNCRSCHQTPKGLHKNKEHSALSCTTCHRPHSWRVTARDTCLTCHEDKKTHYAPEFCGECHPFGMKGKVSSELKGSKKGGS
jgi:nitrate/TMAO reductase-like tetraheme cytochrome c subunit